MFGSKARGALMVLLFLWLAFLTNLSHADGNYLAHAYERLWLWERYQIAISIEGAEKQQDIFPFQRKRGGDTGRDNRGSGRKSTLSYSEFMWRLSDKSIEHDLPVPQLKRPKSAKAIHDAAVELVDKKLTGNLKPVDIDPGLLTGDDPKKDDSDPHRGQMSLLFDKLQLKLSMWRIKGKHDKYIEPRLGKLKEISKAVLKLRKEDSQRYVVKLFKKPINKDGLELDEDDVVTETKTSRVITGPEYEEVMVAETFSNNKDQLLKRFGNEEDLRDWVVNLGNPAVEDRHKYTDPEYSHFRVLATWMNIKEETAMPASVLKFCRKDLDLAGALDGT